MSAKDQFLRLLVSPNPEEVKAFLQSMTQANDSTVRAVITQMKNTLKDRAVPPTTKLAALQLFHQCMGLNNMPFLLFAQKKILRRLGEFARHRKASADPNRGRDLFGPVQGEQQTASIEFLKILLQAVKAWASRYGIAPNGGDSDYLKLYRTLEAERVVFPADSKASPALSSPRAQQSNASKLRTDLGKCKQTADLLLQMLAANPGQSEVAPTASQVSAYKAQLELEIETRSSQSSSEAELNLLLDAHDHLSRALDTYQDYRRSRAQSSQVSVSSAPLQQTQASIDKAEKELSELRNRIYFMRTSEDQNPEQVRMEVERRVREREEAHRQRLAQLNQSLGGQSNGALLEQQLVETMRQAEQLQGALRQKAAEIDRDNKVYAQVSAENRELTKRLEEARKRAYIKAADSPPQSPGPLHDPSFFASARQSLDPFAKQDSLDLAVFQTQRNPFSQSSVPMQEEVSSLPIVNEKEYRLLCFQDKGLLFEDAVVKMGAQLQLAGTTGKCAVFVGNGSQEVLEGVAVQVIAAAGVDVQQETKGAVQVQPGEKVVFTLQVTVQEPFTGCPRLLVMYTHLRSPVRLHLKLPIVVARALQPAHSEASEAYHLWQSLVDTEDLVRFAGLQAGINSMNSLANVVRFRNNLQLYGAKDLPELEKGSVLGVGGLGEQLVAALVTIESNAKSGKIAVRSRSLRLRDAMLGLLKEFIVG